jgi:hypothetical protein
MTGFIIPELIIESIIRDGIQNVRSDKTIIDSVFAQLTRHYNSSKYGETEITKIKTLIDKEIAVLYSYHQVDAKDLSFTIMVGTDTEAKNRAHLGDHYEEIQEQIVDTDELEALHRVDDLQVTNYDPLSGKVTVDDSTNLSPIYKGMIYVDSSQVEHIILGGINNTAGDKSFFIGRNEDVDLSDATGFIKSSLDYEQYEIKGVTGDVNLVIGCHSKDALTTKYLYILLKYFLLSRKKDLISRCFYTSSFSGSDFNRDSQYVGDQIFTRFLTFTGKVDDTWRSDQVVLIDNIEVDPIPIE